MTLHRAFEPRDAFAPGVGYRLLPFRFGRFDSARYIVTNDAGEYVLLPRADLTAFVERRLTPGSATYRTLKAKHFLFDDDARVALDLLALKVRTRAAPTALLTGLHIFVVTLRCDHSCHYCQVSRQTEDRTAFDMSRAHAERALAIAFESPSPVIKVEFQGGEPLLNFELIRHIIERAETINAAYGKDLSFVICSNLSRVDEAILTYCAGHRVVFSASLDGPADLHNRHRPLKDGDSHAATLRGIAQIRARLGPDAVSALMTTTPESLDRVEEIIDEYVRQGFRSIFLRNLSPYGFAVKTRLIGRYSIDAWVGFYKRGLAHILELNRRGYAFREEFASILLGKMFSPSGTGYVDLQSPSGVGIGALIYNYDGAIYASDEGRMLAEMGDATFRLGHLDDASFAAIVTGEPLLDILDATLLESAPMCAECPFLPFCGADPTFHRATQGDVVGHKAHSAFCSKQMALLRHLITLLEDDPSARDILMGWV